jgi:anti-sigma regulatory factor (Ser/Thr protein kinase)
MVAREADLIQVATIGRHEQRAYALPILPISSAAARAYTREVLAHWQLADLTEDIVLIVDELVTNAVRHSAGPITLALDLREGSVHVEVTDDCAAMPSTQSLSDTRTSGRGLAIIDAISDGWGARALAAGGKSVWADVSRHSTPERVAPFTVDLPL